MADEVRAARHAHLSRTQSCGPVGFSSARRARGGPQRRGERGLMSRPGPRGRAERCSRRRSADAAPARRGGAARRYGRASESRRAEPTGPPPPSPPARIRPGARTRATLHPQLLLSRARTGDPAPAAYSGAAPGRLFACRRSTFAGGLAGRVTAESGPSQGRVRGESGPPALRPDRGPGPSPLTRLPPEPDADDADPSLPYRRLTLYGGALLQGLHGGALPNSRS